jgi:hypothetical protein
MLSVLALGTAACAARLGAAAPVHLRGRHATHPRHVGRTPTAPPRSSITPSSTTASSPTGTAATGTTSPTGTAATGTTSPTGSAATGTTSPTGSAATAQVDATPPTTALHGPVTEPPLPPPGPGFVTDQVTAIGDSVMLDYEGPLIYDIPGVHVTAAVSRGWTTGERVLAQLKSADALGAVVIVGLATNGPVSAAQLDSMMSILAGASRVVLVNTRVDRTWQDSNNAVLAEGVARDPRAVLVDWCSLALQHPAWLYPTQTHLPIGGPGAQALAGLVAAAA